MQLICGQTKSASLQVDYTADNPWETVWFLEDSRPGAAVWPSSPSSHALVPFFPFPCWNVGLNNLGEGDLFF